MAGGKDLVTGQIEQFSTVKPDPQTNIFFLFVVPKITARENKAAKSAGADGRS